ncbi:hypothetical protein L484_015870 [Morus notabilis]|uniref:Uncharacterized protein n=1 Tax=Morus notabilis TaxID=981085 RepID=W9QPB0_9ROSA|nr:hypothetical protein L484_015870 [Morus notabilis]
MMLRSSSTPVIGSLLPSFSSESPNHYETKPATIHHSHSKLHKTGSLNLTTVPCNSSPISPSIDCDRFLHKGFRRAQSEGNLEGLAYDSCTNNEDQFCDSNQPKMFTRKPKCMMLQTIPSFSFHNSRGVSEGEEEDGSYSEDDEEREEYDENEELLEEREVRVGDDVMAMESDHLGLEGMMKNMNFIEEVRVKKEICNVGLEQENGLLTQKMYLAKGLGIGGNSGCSGDGGSGGGDYNSFGSGGDEGDKQGVEEYYKRMTKGDLNGAEEYYSRAILADPKDGDVLSQYAKLVWELHHDQDRAASYFERAVQASPQDSHVHAAYASFLWETEDDGEETDIVDLCVIPENVLEVTIASATA